MDDKPNLLTNGLLVIGTLTIAACFPELGDYVAVGGGAGGAGGAAEGGAGGGESCLPLDPDNATCADCVLNGGETDIDCGGDACGPCEVGKVCGNDADCSSGNCEAGLCGQPTGPICLVPDPENPNCGDCELNGSETDVDCGGDACPPCDPGAACSVDADCGAGSCQGQVCVPPTPHCEPVDPDNPSCADCVMNGSETDTDCGGDACSPCELGGACVENVDCASGACASGACVTAQPGCQPVDPENPNCADCVMNGGETGVDCGGDACAPC